jgi:hypothetical protein
MRNAEHSAGLWLAAVLAVPVASCYYGLSRLGMFHAPKPREDKSAHPRHPFARYPREGPLIIPSATDRRDPAPMAPEPEPAPPPERRAPEAVEAPAAVEPRDPTLSPREAAELLAASIAMMA